MLTSKKKNAKIKTVKERQKQKKEGKTMQYQDYERIYGLSVEEYEELNKVLEAEAKAEWEKEMENEEHWKNQFCDW